MTNNVLVIGSGGREHAITWKLSKSARIKNIFVAPGSYGINQLPKVTIENTLNVKDSKVVAEWCKKNTIDLVVVGPEDPLANGIADALIEHGIACFGPVKKGAQIEADKSWAKAFMDKYDIPSAKWQAFTDAKKAKEYINNAKHAALVVKASGLAAGKGVVVAADKSEACAAVEDMLSNNKFGKASETIVVEELLEGYEVSVLAFTDGKTIEMMLPAQDHKRIGENDVGLNTGGMGAYCPAPVLNEKQLSFIKKNVLERTIEGLTKENIKFVGVLYAGLMITNDGVKVLEFNCRFGDPETQVILPLLESDLFEIMESCCNGMLHKQKIVWKTNMSAVGVVMASRGYPETSSKGQVITGIDTVEKLKDHIIFHSGTAYTSNGDIVTNGGRVLIAVVVAPSLFVATQKATKACQIIKFDGSQFRTDIAHNGILRSIVQNKCKSGNFTVSAKIELNRHVMSAIESTSRPELQMGIERLGYKEPILVCGTDGVGTKLKIAQICGIHDTVGIDLVAMCANDLLAQGAESLMFSDYYACGALETDIAKKVICSIAEGCRQAGCCLIEGDVVEIPDLYDAGVYDLAGFAVGVVERTNILPRLMEIKEGDVVIGLPSTGVHSNGFSLVRKVMDLAGAQYTDLAPFSTNKKTYGEEFLTPTKIYVKSLLPVIHEGHIKAFAHITGGGLLENIPRILPSNLKVSLDANNWTILPVFGWLAALGKISEYEMLRTFNCGIGGVLIVKNELKEQVLNKIKELNACVIGTVQARTSNESQVKINNFENRLSLMKQPYVKLSGEQKKTEQTTYEASGVSITAGNELVQRIKASAKSTHRAGLLGGIGGFGGLFDLKPIGNKNPALICQTKGIGNKLKVAQKCGIHTTVGIDLVAASVNDLLAEGAEPLLFSDYYACGALDVDVAEQVVNGIAEGCRQAGCCLIGGETAEMPDMYHAGDYDLASCAVGIKSTTSLETIKDGDVIIGLPSTSVHYNGFDVIDKVVKSAGLQYSDFAAFSSEGKTYGEEFLTPTRIYVKPLLPTIRSGIVKRFVPIAEGGLVENISKVLPTGVKANLDANCWPILPVFGWLATMGRLSKSEILNTFNCGIGGILIVAAELKEKVLNDIKELNASIIGSVQSRIGDEPPVQIKHFEEKLMTVMRPYVRSLVELNSLQKKKVGVLISGSGTNLQALIDASLDESKHIGAEIVLVISNKADAFGLKRAEKANIPTKVINHKDYASRVEFDQVMTDALVEANVEIVCLAGFMRILSSQFVQRWHGHLINVHPSLLPSFKGTHAQRQALEAGVRVAGCTVHFVEDDIDAGAIIVQETVPVLPNDTEDILIERIKTVEHKAFPKALRLIATEKISLNSEKKIVWH